MNVFTGSEQMPSKKEEAKPSAAENLKDVKHKIIVMSGKGGVGKSTVAVNLATALTMSGKKVGLLDADMHGPSIPMMFGLQDSQMIVNDKGKIQPIQTASNVKIISIALLLENSDSPVIWRGPVKMGAIKQFLEEVEWGALDYLIVDLPPGTGDEPLSVAQLVPSPDGVVIVTTPQDVALIDARKADALGEEWARFAAATSNVPFSAIVEGRNHFSAGEIGLARIATGLAAFAVMLAIHPWLFGVRAY